MTFHVLQLNQYPIYDQLLLEERLLRHSELNWCVINRGSCPAIVMGISGKKEELVDCARAQRDQIPLIRRFSGGGTVVVDEQTLFVTFISQKALHPFAAYPEPIMQWTEPLYKEAIGHPDFALRENDYVIRDKKCGGNAQYIRKERWLHHTSWLWHYSADKMQYLLQPQKAPPYRQGRSHTEFLCQLADYLPSQETFITGLLGALGHRFNLSKVPLSQIALLPPLERQSTTLIADLI